MGEDVLADVRALLEVRWRTGVALRIQERHRPHVWRVQVQTAGDADLPPSVIVRLGPDRLEQPPPPGIDWEAVFANEWAGSMYLNSLPEIRSATPEVLAEDLDAQLLIAEDVGAGPSLDMLLLGDDLPRAVEALIEHARLLGRIAAVSRSRTDDYRRLRAQAGPAKPASLLDELDSRELRDVLPRLTDQLGVTVPAGLPKELDDLDREAREPGRWLAYTPADACPDNCVVKDGTVRIFDFGFGGLRHLALDAVYGLIPFPTCWCYAPIPQMVSARMIEAFRAELAPTFPEAADDAVWRQKLAWACATWFVGFVVTVAHRELHRDQHRGPLPARHAAVAQLEAIASHTGDHLPAVSELARRLVDLLRRRWGVGDIPGYPALQGADCP